jgi:hydroxymethylglutaryl-CoA reductase (NADPH)
MSPAQDNSTEILTATIPLRYAGPLTLTGDVEAEALQVPLATYESPLWPSVERGFRITARSGGIAVRHKGQMMTRSIVLQAGNAMQAHDAARAIEAMDFTPAIRAASNYAGFRECRTETWGRRIYIRLGISTGDAAGHNMATVVAHAVMKQIMQAFPDLSYVSISGNVCTDKKVSAVNALYGRGHSVIASANVSEKLCRRMLRASPQDLRELHIAKNLKGSLLAGSLRSANAHVGNMLLALYLATGQDGVNIIEGSQGLTDINIAHDGGVEISCHLPNIIMGTIGNGKDCAHALDALEALGCTPDRDNPGAASARLAMIAGATCLAGELSLLAAQVNEDELVESHTRLERG